MGLDLLLFIILMGICYVFNTPILGYIIIVVLWILKYKFTKYCTNNIIQEDNKRRTIETNIQNKNKNKKYNRVQKAKNIIQQYEQSDDLILNRKNDLIRKYTQLERKRK